MKPSSLALVASTLACGTISCLPKTAERESLVTGARILAVVAEPPEVAPGEKATYKALVVRPDGTATDAPVAWEFCVAPKPLTEEGVVSDACLAGYTVPIGVSLDPVTATTPLDACSNFGPDTPPGNYRPRDPDSTGGYFQPVHLGALDVLAFGLERIRCNLANAPVDAALEYAKNYVANTNPAQEPLVARVHGELVPLDAIPAGEEVDLKVAWLASTAESYISFEPNLQTIVQRREALVVAWFVTAGSVDSDVTGRAESDPGTDASNMWHAPATPGVVHLWTVLRDSRGGSSFASYDLTVVSP